MELKERRLSGIRASRAGSNPFNGIESHAGKLSWAPGPGRESIQWN